MGARSSGARYARFVQILFAFLVHGVVAFKVRATPIAPHLPGGTSLATANPSSSELVERLARHGFQRGKMRSRSQDGPSLSQSLHMSADAQSKIAPQSDHEKGMNLPRLSKPGTFESSLQRWCDRATSAFPLWVLASAVLGITRPATLTWFGGNLITAALATTMVCMGMTLRVEDFAAIARRPRPVVVGVLAQYTVMPFLGYMTGRLFRLSPALATGVALVGCCPGGTASNLVTLIAKGDVALSVSMTTVSTLLATAVTGPLTKMLVGSLVNVSAAALMIATVQVVFLPVALGLILNSYAGDLTRRLSPYTPFLCVILVSLICGGVISQNSAVLLGSGMGVVGAVLTLHAMGFAMGYGGMRWLGFSERQARTGSIEVGMQNSGLAVVLAQRGLGDPASAIPGAVSATCHSLIGSAAAAYWRARDRNGPTAATNESSGTKSG